MIVFEELIQLPQDINSVFPIISDFSYLQEWDPGIKKVEKITPGPLRIGTAFHIYAEFFFQVSKMTYTLLEYEQNKKVVYIGQTENVKILDTIEFFHNSEGCLIKYNASFEFLGVLSKLEIPLKIILQNTANNAFNGMRNAFSNKEIIDNQYNEYFYKLLFPIVYDFSILGYNSSKQNYKYIHADLSSKNILITGGSSGIGFETAKLLAQRGANIIICGQNEIKLHQAKNSLIKQTDNPNIYMEICDLSLMSETKSLANRVMKRWDHLDILVNNAGALFNERYITAEGFEKSFALLLLSPYLLTNLLKPILEKAKDGARVVNVSSGGMYTQKLETEDFFSEKSYNGSVAYAKAKRGLNVLSEFWAREWADSKISSFCMHPGWADTQAVKDSLPEFYRITKPFLRSPQEGADTIFWLSASHELKNHTGGFYLDRTKQPLHVFFTENTKEEEKLFLNRVKNFVSDYLHSINSGN